jgi:hypothetical protein
MSANRQFKNSVFTTLFDAPDKLLSLYNAVTGNGLPLDTPLEITTLDDVLFTDRHNDIAFVIDDKVVVLIEHQSSICANMPLRLLIYVARIYEKLIDKDAIYMRSLLKIPKPDFIVLYNGVDPFPDNIILRLSDAYKDTPDEVKTLDGSLELEVRVININEGRNDSLVKKSKDLHGYALFVGKVRKNVDIGMDLTAAVTKTVKDCIEEDILAEFFKEHSSEVINMLTTEWSLERAIYIREREAREEGIDISARIIRALKNNNPIEEISARFNVAIEKIEELKSLFE